MLDVAHVDDTGKFQIPMRGNETQDEFNETAALLVFQIPMRGNEVASAAVPAPSASGVSNPHEG